MMNQPITATVTNAQAATAKQRGGAWDFACADRVAATVAGCAVWGVFALLASGWGTGGRTWTLPASYDGWAYLTAWGNWWMGAVALLASVQIAFGSRWLRRVVAYHNRLASVAPLASGDPKNLHTVWVGGLSSAGEMLAWLPLFALVTVIGAAPYKHTTDAPPWVYVGWGVLMGLSALSLIVGMCLCAGVAFRQVGAWCRHNAAPPLGDYVAGVAFLLMLFVLVSFSVFWTAGFNPSYQTNVSATSVPTRAAPAVPHFDSWGQRC